MSDVLSDITGAVGDFASNVVDSYRQEFEENPVNTVVDAALDAGGFIPVVGAAFDGVHAVKEVAAGDMVGAGVYAACAVPIVGDALGVAKTAANVGSHAAGDVVRAAVSSGAKPAVLSAGAVTGADTLIRGLTDLAHAESEDIPSNLTQEEFSEYYAQAMSDDYAQLKLEKEGIDSTSDEYSSKYDEYYGQIYDGYYQAAMENSELYDYYKENYMQADSENTQEDDMDGEQTQTDGQISSGDVMQTTKPQTYDIGSMVEDYAQKFGVDTSVQPWASLKQVIENVGNTLISLFNQEDQGVQADDQVQSGEAALNNAFGQSASSQRTAGYAQDDRESVDKSVCGNTTPTQQADLSYA